MNQQVTKAIVLARTNYGEADRILTVLTPDFGKLSLMAKGVRKVKSKLAGGIELFSVSQITFIRGRGEVATLVSSRLETHFASIVKDLARVQLGYEFLKLVNRNTEDNAESGYYELLAAALAALDDASVSLALVRLFLEANLLALAGHRPNLSDDENGQALAAGQKYNFDASAARFSSSGGGQYTSEAIKFLRIVFSGNSARALARIDGAEALALTSQPLVTAMIRQYLRV